jgi:hypothetical protein
MCERTFLASSGPRWVTLREASTSGAPILRQAQDIPHRIAFIGNQGEHHHENLKKSAEENAHDWMRDVNDQYIRAFALFVKRMSAYIEQEAKAYGFEYIEMDNARLGDVTEAVMTSLGLSIR